MSSSAGPDAPAAAPELPQLPTLQQMCLRVVKRHLGPSNCVELWQYTSQLECDGFSELQQEAYRFMVNTFEYLSAIRDTQQLAQVLGEDVAAQLGAAAAQRQQTVQLQRRAGRVMERQQVAHASTSSEPPVGGTGSCSYPLTSLQAGVAWPPDVDPSQREAWLSGAEFQRVFGMAFVQYQALPSWKKTQLKKQHGLF